MDDLLDSAQKIIDDAAKGADPASPAPAQPPPAPSTQPDQPSLPTSLPPEPTPTPPEPPVPAPTPVTPNEPISPPVEHSVAPPPEPPPTATSEVVDTLLHQPPVAADTDSKSEESPPTGGPPPLVVKKKKGGKGVLIATLLVLLLSLPLGVFFISNRQQLGDLRGRASLCCEGGECNNGWTFGRDDNTPQDSCATRARVACDGSLNNGGSGGLKSGGEQCGGGGTPVPTNPPSTGGTTGGQCTGYSLDGSGKCTSSGKCRTYGECCGPGKVRTVTATCLSDGREQFDAGTCGVDNSGTCGSSGAGANCQAGWFFWPSKDGGDDKCHDISAPAAPGGGTSNCSISGGCTSTAPGGCAKRYTCLPNELTPQGFCLKNFGDAQLNTSYQEEANRTCKYIQVDVFDANQCAGTITTTTAHKGTITYKPDLGGAGCTGGGTQFQSGGGGNPTPTPTPAPQCTAIKLYDASGADITAAVGSGSRKLTLGETITLATPKGTATKAHFRIQGITDFTDNDTALTTATEYRLKIQIPTTLTQAQGNFEVEVFVGGVWK